MVELRAFETGVWFSEAPVTTQIADLTLTISDAFGSGVSEHEYAPAVDMLPTADLGDRILTSRINFQTKVEATAFAAGLTWYGAFFNVDLRGTEVVVQQKRGDNEDDEALVYEYETLRGLIADYRANLRPASASA
jgi:hypothetical protein